MLTLSLINTLTKMTLITQERSTETMMKRLTALGMMSQWIWTMVLLTMEGEDHQMIINMAHLLIILMGDLLMEDHMVDHLAAGMMMGIPHRDHMIK